MKIMWVRILIMD